MQQATPEIVSSTGLEIYTSAERLAQAYMVHAPRIIQLREQLLEEIDALNSTFKSCDVAGCFTAEIKICEETDAEDIPRELARTAWRSIINRMGIRRFMGTKSKEQLDSSLQRGSSETLPDITPANVESGILAYARSVNEFIQENIAETYRNLKPWASDELKTNAKNRWMLSNKIIMKFAVEQGYSSKAPYRLSYGRQGSTVETLETIFRLLDGKGFRATHISDIGQAIQTSATGETEYFRFRACKNRNLHLEFKRQDLVDLFNQIAGNSRQLRGRDSDPFGSWSARDFTEEQGDTIGKQDLFETPQRVAEALVRDFARVEPGERVLEPSCGPGRIVRAILAAGASCKAIDIQTNELDRDLQDSPAVSSSLGLDFLTASPDMIGRFHHVIMNPPFSGKRDVLFVAHAWQFVAAGGSLTAIMSAGVKFRTDKKTEQFRQWVHKMGGTITDLPAGTFAESGTNVSTVVVHVRCREAAQVIGEE